MEHSRTTPAPQEPVDCTCIQSTGPRGATAVPMHSTTQPNNEDVFLPRKGEKRCKWNLSPKGKVHKKQKWTMIGKTILCPRKSFPENTESLPKSRSTWQASTKKLPQNPSCWNHWPDETWKTTWKTKDRNNILVDSSLNRENNQENKTTKVVEKHRKRTRQVKRLA